VSDAFYTGLRDTTAGPLIEKYGMPLSLVRVTPIAYNPLTGSNAPIVISSAKIAATADSFTDTDNGFITAGLVQGSIIQVSGFTTTGNNGIFTIASIAAGEIHVTPVPAAVEALGATINITTDVSRTYSCFGLVEEFKTGEIISAMVRAGDKKLLLSAKNLSVTPQVGDQFTGMPDGTWYIPEGSGAGYNPVQPLAPGGIPVLYTIQVRK
jgi:hypothetical protein